MKQYEEFKTIRPLWSWLLLIGFCALIVLWGLVIFRIIPQRARHWDFGALPDTPSQSIYSTDRPGRQQNVTPPPQIPVLPEAAPLTATQPSGPETRPAGTSNQETQP